MERSIDEGSCAEIPGGRVVDEKVITVQFLVFLLRMPPCHAIIPHTNDTINRKNGYSKPGSTVIYSILRLGLSLSCIY